MIRVRTNLDDLRTDGYVEFWHVVPENLRLRCIEELNKNPDEFWYWTGPLAEEFREWFRAFLLRSVSEIFGESALAVFNRNPGRSMDWHEDSSGGDVNYGRRVFCSVYLTMTTEEQGALRIMPESHRISKATFDLGQPIDSETHAMPDGTVFIGDERLMHSVAENKGPNRRTMVMWWRWIPIEK